MSARIAVAAAALLLFAAVGAGAFGAHLLRARLAPELLVVYHTAVQYQAWHALGLLAVGLLLRGAPADRWLVAAGWLLIGGIVFFCGSLYLLALTGARSLGAVTPVGGVAFLAAWLALAWSAWRG
jgi:uncharacterized membrane protein YgdD (TMEM256/DUF423 family)